MGLEPNHIRRTRGQSVQSLFDKYRELILKFRSIQREKR